MAKQCKFCFEEYDEKYDMCPNCGHLEDEMQENPDALQIGKKVGNRYLVGECIEKNQNFLTYICWDTVIETKVRMYEYFVEGRCSRISDGSVMDLLDEESAQADEIYKELLGACKNKDVDHTVKILDVLKEAGTVYIIEEFISGKTLAEVLQEKHYTEREAFDLLEPVTGALMKLEEMSVYYPSLSSSDVIAADDGNLYLKRPLLQEGTGEPVGSWSNVKQIALLIQEMSGQESQNEIIKAALNPVYTERTQSLRDFRNEYRLNLKIQKEAKDKKKSQARRKKAEQNRKRKLVVLLAGVCVLLAAAIVIVVSIFSCSKKSSKYLEQVEVPNIVNINISEAMDTLNNCGLMLEISETRYEEGVEPNIVLSQSIEPGEMVLANSTISVVVSEDVELEIVPEVRGLKEASAVSVLSLKGFDAEVEYEFSKVIAEGNVISQESDGTAPVGSSIKIVVSKGMDPDDAAESEEFEMPLLVGCSYDEALEIAEKYGFVINVTDRSYSSDYPAETIVSQSIESGAVMSTGMTVDIAVSLGQEMAIVPNVVLMSQANGCSALTNRKLNYTLTEAYSATAAKGAIIGQSIAAGTQVPVGTSVQLTISKGKEQSTVPSVVGRSETDARNMLTAAGLMVNVTYEEDDNNVGNVLRQSISAGQTVDRSSTVTIIVAKGSGKVTVPSVVGKTKEEAESTLSGAGLGVSVSEEYSETVAAGSVISQTPESSEKVPKGSSVALVISKGKQVIPVSSITVSPTSVKLNIGESASVSAEVKPENATDPGVTWSSADPGIASVSGGEITAKAAGTTTITATNADGTVAGSCSVTVSEPVREIGITANTDAVKKEYQQNESFVSTGLTITLHYSDGSSVPVLSGFSCSTPDMSSAGEKKVTVTYKSMQTDFSIMVNKHEHTYNGYSSDATGHWQVCTKCGEKSLVEAEAHTFGEYVSAGESGHYRVCSDCGYKTKEEKHAGGTATCKQKAVCSVCKEEYGSLSTTHKFDKYVQDGEEGHHVECSVCGEKSGSIEGHTYDYIYVDENGHNKVCSVCKYNKLEGHSGGTASATARATCKYCLKEYGATTETSATETAEQTATEKATETSATETAEQTATEKATETSATETPSTQSSTTETSSTVSESASVSSESEGN